MTEGIYNENEIFNSEYVQTKMGRTIAQNYVDIMVKPILDYDDFLYIIKWFWDFELIPGSKEPGNAVNYMVGLAHPNTEDPLLQNYTPDEIEAWLSQPMNSSQVKAQFAMAYNKVMQKPLSIGQYSALSYNSRQYNWEHYEDKSDLFWVKHMLKKSASSIAEAGSGTITVFYGVQGSGKTDMSLKQWEHLNNLHLHSDYAKHRLVTNIKINDSGYENTYVTTIGQMLYKVFVNNSQNASTLIALDELTINGIRKKKTMAKETTNLDEIDRGLRKFGADVSYIWHFDTEIPKETYARSSLLVHKLGSPVKPNYRKRAILIKQDGQFRKTYMVKGIEQTNIHFESSALAYLVLDIRFSDLMMRSAKLSEENISLKEYYQELANITDTMIDESKGDDLEEDDLKGADTIETMLARLHISEPTLNKLRSEGYIKNVGVKDKKVYLKINPQFEWSLRDKKFNRIEDKD